MGWKFKGSTFNDEFYIKGIDIFKCKWEYTGEYAQVTDPQYGQKFVFKVWKIIDCDKEIIFAAGEFSNGIFGIFMR